MVFSCLYHFPFFYFSCNLVDVYSSNSSLSKVIAPYFVYWPAMVNSTLSAWVITFPITISWGVWCTRWSRSDTVLKLRWNVWKVLWGKGTKKKKKRENRNYKCTKKQKQQRFWLTFVVIKFKYPIQRAVKWMESRALKHLYSILESMELKHMLNTCLIAE